MIDQLSNLGSSTTPDPIVQDASNPPPDVVVLEIVKQNGATPFLDAAGEPRLGLPVSTTTRPGC